MERLAAMEVFVSIVESGSFSKGAKRLRLSQPAVSKTVQQLERRLGVSLIRRSNKGLNLTEAGHRFYEQSKRIIDQIEETEQAVRGSSMELSGNLRISVPTTFAQIYLLPALPKFMRRHPHLSFDMLVDDQHIDLLGAGIDVSLRIGTMADSNMIARKLGERARMVVGTPAYFERAGIPTHPSELNSHEMIVYALKRGSLSRLFRRGEAEVLVEMKGRLHISGTEGVRAAVLADTGLAVASEWVFARELADNTVKAVLTDWLLPPAELWAVYPTGKLVSAKARAFVAFVEEILSESMPARGQSTIPQDGGPATPSGHRTRRIPVR